MFESGIDVGRGGIMCHVNLFWIHHFDIRYVLLNDLFYNGSLRDFARFSVRCFIIENGAVGVSLIDYCGFIDEFII